MLGIVAPIEASRSVDYLARMSVPLSVSESCNS